MHLLSETDTMNRKRKRKPRIKNKFPVKSTFLSEISFLSLLSTLISIKTVSCRHFLSLSPSRLLQQCFSFSTSLLLRSSLSLEPLHLSSVACFFLPTFFRLLSFLLCFSVLKTFYGFASFLSVSQNQTSIITIVSQSNSISFSTSLCLLLSANLKVDSFPSKERTSKRQNLSVHKLAEFPLEVKPQSILYLFKCLRIEFSRRKFKMRELVQYFLGFYFTVCYADTTCCMIAGAFRFFHSLDHLGVVIVSLRFDSK